LIDGVNADNSPRDIQKIKCETGVNEKTDYKNNYRPNSQTDEHSI